MKIDFVRSGGFAGIRLAGSFDTQQLLPEQSSILDKLITDSGFFSLPEDIQQTAPGPDRFEFQISISTGQQSHSIRVNDAVMPDRLRPLVEYLTTLAMSSKKG